MNQYLELNDQIPHEILHASFPTEDRLQKFVGNLKIAEIDILWGIAPHTIEFGWVLLVVEEELAIGMQGDKNINIDELKVIFIRRGG